MSPGLEETVTFDFITSSPTTGAAADADTTPTFEVFENVTDTALTLTGSSIAKRTGKTGNYRATFTIAASDGFEAGKSYNVVASATVGGVAAKALIGRFQARDLAAFLRSTIAIAVGTVTTGASTTSIPTSSLTPAAAVTDQFKGRIVIFTKDTTTANLRGQASDITGSSSGGTLTVTALTTAPASGDIFVIV